MVTMKECNLGESWEESMVPPKEIEKENDLDDSMDWTKG